MNRIIAAAAATAATLAFASPALAGSAEGKIQVKALGTAVLPDGKITDVKTDIIGLPATGNTRATDSVVPTVAVEYFLTPNFSVETICCVTPHDVRGTGTTSTWAAAWASPTPTSSRPRPRPSSPACCSASTRVATATAR